MLTNKQLEIEVQGILEDIRKYFKGAQAKGAIVGNSGGKDSATVIGLFAKALGPENVYTLTLPCGSNNEDKKDANLVSEAFNVRCANVLLDDTFESIVKSMEKGTGLTLSSESLINTKPRLRMTALYAIAQTLGYLVCGTGNLCEITVGYFTKHGDGACDYNPLAEFTVEEVYQIARYIGVPEKILKKAPSDGLSGKTDEEKLGVLYSQISEYKETGTTDASALEKIKHLERISAHKRCMPAVYHRRTKAS